MITILSADPPWQYRDKLQMDLVSRSSDDHYKTLTLPQIHTFLADHGPNEHASDDFPAFTTFADKMAPVSILFMWVTNPFLLSGDGPAVCRSWGYEPKQLIPWVKGRLDAGPDGPKLILRTGMGFYTRGVTEHLIVATRGTATDLIKSKSENGLIVAPEEAFILGPRGAHSEKPEASYQLIERLCHGPYTELFARKWRPGWECYGDQLR